MNNEKTKEYINKVNDSYLKILSEDANAEVKEKNRLAEVIKNEAN